MTVPSGAHPFMEGFSPGLAGEAAASGNRWDESAGMIYLMGDDGDGFRMRSMYDE